MRRLPAAVSVLVISLLAIGGSASVALAQDASPMPTATSPLVGAWLIDIDGDPNTDPTQGIFHADGSYIQTDQGANVAVGAWESTGPSTADLTFAWYGVDQSGVDGSTTVRVTVTVGPDGQSLTAVYTLEFSRPGLPTGQMGPGTATGTRVAVEPMGTPVAPLS